jgi:hypothetical protein
MRIEGPNYWPEHEERADTPAPVETFIDPNTDVCGHSEADGRYWVTHEDGTVTNEAPNLHPE